MQIDIHHGIILIGDQMMILAGFTHHDIAGTQSVGLTINLHHSPALQNDKHFAIVRMYVSAFAVARGTGTPYVMRALPRHLEAHPAMAQVRPGNKPRKDMFAALGFQL